MNHPPCAPCAPFLETRGTQGFLRVCPCAPDLRGTSGGTHLKNPTKPLCAPCAPDSPPLRGGGMARLTRRHHLPPWGPIDGETRHLVIVAEGGA